MKFIFYIVIFLFLLGCSQNKFREVNYNLNSDTANFGKIGYNDTFEKVIHLRNISNYEIKILKIENGCGCTSGKIVDSTVKANDSVGILVSYIPLLTKDSGFVEKYITIRTDATPPFRNIVLIGEVRK